MKKERSFEDLKPWQQRLHRVIFGIDTRIGKIFDIVLLWAILISVVIVMLESVKEIAEPNIQLLKILEWFFTILFTLEYIARISSTPNPKKYITSFMGIVDLLSLIPSYLGLFVSGSESLKVIRSIRLIRVFRVLKLTHFMGGANQLGGALYNSRHKIVVFLGAVVCVTVIMGTLMYMVEGSEHGFTSIPQGIYWAIVTITTVGYGDLAPTTVFGQSMASALMIVGYAVLAVPTGIVTSEIMHAKKSSIRQCNNCSAQLTLDQAHYCHNCGTHIEDEEENLK
ncbi:MAG: ion transporter [Cytophagales bacterium]|nr:ion transporter [Cytophagales bacterium]